MYCLPLLGHAFLHAKLPARLDARRHMVLHGEPAAAAWQRFADGKFGCMRDCIALERTRRPFSVIAWVVLPEHLHCIWRLPEGDADYATRWRRIKTDFSRRMSKTEYRSSIRRARGERGIWQRRYWEHAIRDEIDLRRHIDYIHFNPVKHGHVDAVRDWPFSSFHRYVRRGELLEDWAGP